MRGMLDRLLHDRLTFYGILLLFNVFVFIVLSNVLPIMFEDNDDTTMVWIANGIYSGTPDCHLVFINALYGWVLAQLYSILPNVEWYVVSFAFLQIVSITILVGCFYNRIQNRAQRFLIIVLFYSIWSLLIVRLQFTTTAAFVAFAACLLLINKRFAYGGPLFVIASLIRFDAAGLVGLILVPIFLYEFKFDVKSAYLPLFIVLLCALTFKFVDKMFYDNKEWNTYYQLNQYRGKINDNPNSWRVRDDLPTGMKTINYDILYSFAMDPSVTDVIQLKEIVHKLNNTPIRKKSLNVWNCYIKRYHDIIILLFVLFLTLFFVSDNRWNKILLICSFLLWFLILAYISTNASVKYRVFISSLIPLFFYVFYVIAKRDSLYNHRSALWVDSMIAVSAIYIFIIPAIKRMTTICDFKPIIDEQMCLYKKRGKSMVLPAGADLSVEYLPPFELYKAIDKHSFINPYCMAGSPLTPEYMSYKDLVDENIVIFSSKADDDFKLRQDALSENYALKTDTIHVVESSHYVLIRFVKTSCD